MKTIRETDLSPDQRVPYDLILNWIGLKRTVPGQEDPGVLTLGGFAGTGKTSVLGALAYKLDSERIAFCAYTGKAAHVLRGKLAALGVEPGYCGTIHGLIYETVIDELGKAIFQRVLDLPYSMIVVDEASMVPETMFNELRSYSVPILAVGDHGQLPPVASSFNLMENPLLRLEKIHRQAEHNPIIQLSAQIRLNGELRRDLEGENIVFLTTEEQDDTAMRLLFGAQQPVEALYDQAVIVRSNNMRVARNTHARNIRFGFGADELPPQKNEQVICLRNDKRSLLFNGMRGHLEEAPSDYDENRLAVDVRIHDEDRTVNGLLISKHQFSKEKTFASYEDLHPFGFKPHGWKEIGGLFDYGYALTAHKCVDGATLVETPRGLVRIDSLARQTHGLVGTPNGAKGWVRCVRNATQPRMRITTEGGYSVIVSPEHGLDVWSGEQFERVEARDIKEGAFLRLRLGIECDAVEAPVLPTMDFEKALAIERYQRVELRGEAITPLTLTSDVAEFIGLMCADGTVWKSGFRLAKKHEDLVDRFSELVYELFRLTPKRFFTLGAHHSEVNSVVIADWLRSVGGLNPNAKSVSPVILRAPLAIQAAFLRGLFADGSVNVKDGRLDHIEWSTVFTEMGEIVQTMLLRFGIITTRRVMPAGETRVYIYGQFAKRFGSTIGFVEASKQERLSAPCGESTRYRIPLSAADITANFVRQTATNARASGYLSRAIVVTVPALRERLRFHYPRVVLIEQLPAGPTYCLEVPDGHQFLQNGFAGWNSQGSQFTDVLLVYEKPARMDDYSRRWLYTAATRASERIAILVC